MMRTFFLICCRQSPSAISVPSPSPSGLTCVVSTNFSCPRKTSANEFQSIIQTYSIKEKRPAQLVRGACNFIRRRYSLHHPRIAGVQQFLQIAFAELSFCPFDLLVHLVFINGALLDEEHAERGWEVFHLGETRSDKRQLFARFVIDKRVVRAPLALRERDHFG